MSFKYPRDKETFILVKYKNGFSQFVAEQVCVIVKLQIFIQEDTQQFNPNLEDMGRI
jgi:hypothetical protein